MKKSYNRSAPESGPLPPPSVYLVCSRRGRWVGDVLRAPTGRPFPPGEGVVGNGRYHVGLVACPKHRHRMPTDVEVQAAWAEAERNIASVPLRVDEAR